MKDKLTNYSSPLALAITMTRNQALDRLRKHKPLLIDDGGMADHDQSSETPQVILENSESFNHINSIIEKLPDKHREAITMHDIDGLSYQEISEMTGTNLATLRVNLSRARESVREQLKRIYHE
jgi:RNA polymerase sigma-70 factor (ECF subfamily)